MSFADLETLKDVVGAVSSGPDGFGIHYEVASGAVIDAVMHVDVKLNEQSLAAARARSESGADKIVAGTLEETPNPSPSITAIAANQAGADNRYLAAFANKGLTSAAERSLTPPRLSGGHRPDYRALSAKNPLVRIRQRRLLQLRKTFDEIAHSKNKSVAVNPENLPREALAKMVEAAIGKGDQNTPLGPLPKAAKTVGYNPDVWKRWGHMLIDGSFPSTPHTGVSR